MFYFKNGIISVESTTIDRKWGLIILNIDFYLTPPSYNIPYHIGDKVLMRNLEYSTEIDCVKHT